MKEQLTQSQIKKEQLTQSQIKYAMNRVSSVVRQKEQTLRDKFTKPSKHLSGEQEIKLVLSGKVKKRQIPYDRHCSPYLSDVFDFSKYQDNGSFDEKSFNAEMKPIRKKVQEINDNLMLGDAKEALKMIQEFEKL